LFDLNPLQRIIASAPGFLLAITLHEVAHGYVAYLCGDDTAKRAGRLTLSPLAHLDPVGTLMFILSSIFGYGFGWAKPVPVSPWRLRNPRRDRALLTIAGPAANFLQAVAWAVLFQVVWSHPEILMAKGLAILCFYGAMINVVLLVFNLLPIPPLDGAHVAAWVLRVRDPSIVDRLAPVGFIALLLFINTRGFDLIIGRIAWPLLGFLLRLG